MQEVCDTMDVNIKEVRSGSGRRFVSEARRIIARRFLKDHGMPLSDITRHAGVSISAISRMITIKQLNSLNSRMSPRPLR